MSLSKIYKDGEAGLKKAVLFNCPVNKIMIEPGFNIRDTDPAHVNAILEQMKRGAPIPPLRVKDVNGQVIVVDGHHTFRAAKALCVEYLMCEDVSHLTYSQQVALMITSTQGRKLAPLERGEGFQRMRSDGMHPKEIAEECGCSLSTVDLHLLLMDGDETIKQLLKDGKINFADACEMIRKHGHMAGEIVRDKVEENGGEKVKTKQVRPSYPAKKARRAVELATQIEMVGNQDLSKASDDQSITLRCPAGTLKELLALINDYCEVGDEG